jgi:hypothetical protein
LPSWFADEEVDAAHWFDRSCNVDHAGLLEQRTVIRSVGSAALSMISTMARITLWS